MLALVCVRCNVPTMEKALVALALSASFCLSPLGAFAASPAPFTEFAFDARRAGDTPERLEALATARPHFARVWFYGQVFDLATAGVSDKVKAGLLPRLQRIAEALARGAEPDAGPRILLSRVTTGTAQELATLCRTLEDELLSNAKAGTPLSASVAAATHPEAARISFHRLLYRAELTRERLGNTRDATPIVATARRIAESYALAMDDLGPWATIRAWDGADGPIFSPDQVIEQLVSRGLDALVAGDPALGRRKLEEALAAARATRGFTMHTALVLNGAANAAARGGDAASARSLRQQVLTQVRPLGDDRLVALLAERMTRVGIIRQDAGEVAASTRELRSLGAAARLVPEYLRTLQDAAAFLRTAARSDAAAGRFTQALSALEESALLWTLLAQPEVLRVSVVTSEVEGQKFLRLRAAHDVQLERAELELRRGRLTETEQALDAARTGYTALGVADGLAQEGLARTRWHLAAGRLDEALEAVDGALGRLAGAPAVSRADAMALRAEVFLRRGAFDAALKVADEGAALLGVSGEATLAPGSAGAPTLARLDRAAAVALDAQGRTDDAAARLERGFVAHPSTQTALLQAQLAFEAGAPDRVGQILASLPADVLDPRIAAVYLGCAQVAAGRSTEALVTLRGVLGFQAPESRAVEIGGRTCLAAAHLAQKTPAQANAVLLGLPPLLADLPEPHLEWRVAAVEADYAWAQGRAMDAASAARRATERWVDALGDAAWLGRTLDTRTPAWPARPDATFALAVDAFAAAGRGVKNKASAESSANLAAAVAQLAFVRQRFATPADLERTLWSKRPAEDAALRSAQATLFEAHSRLKDARLDAGDRAALAQSARGAVTRLRDAARDLRTAHPAWAVWAMPAPLPAEAHAPRDGEARLTYAVGPERSHAFLWLRGEAGPRYVPLPGRDALGKLLEPIVAATLGPPEKLVARRPDPNAADWKALTAGAKLLLPWFVEKKVAPALVGVRIRVEADGPLLRVPLDALVLAPPPPRSFGAAPVFFGTAYATSHVVLPHVAPAPRAAEATEAWVTVGPHVPGIPNCLGGALAQLAKIDPCAGLQSGRELERVRAVLGTAAGHTVVSPASPDQLRTALKTARTVHLAARVDAVTGDITLTATAPDATSSSFRPADLALSGALAERILLTDLSPPTLSTETGEGLLRLVGAMRYAGVPELSVLTVRGPTDEDTERVAEVAATSTTGADPGESLRAILAALRGLPPATADQAPAWHPQRWARWSLLGR